MGTLVLGAGPVGLLCAHLLRAPCLGEAIGGGAALRRLAPSVLWDSPALTGLLGDLGLPVDREEVRFGFWGPRGVTRDVTSGERAEYLRRSGRDPASAPASAVSSGASGSVLALRCSVDALCQCLAGRVEVQVGTVSRVLPDPAAGRVRVLATCGELGADRVVNTLPAPTFDRLLDGAGGPPRTWDVGSKWFVDAHGAWADPLREARDAGLRWLYVTDPRIPFDRVTIRGDGCSYEFNSEPPTWFPDAVFGGTVTGPLPLQVRGEPRAAAEFGGLVRHAGRMARWDHRIRLHNVLEELLGEVLGG